jgi:hypothetical protein
MRKAWQLAFTRIRTYPLPNHGADAELLLDIELLNSSFARPTRTCFSLVLLLSGENGKKRYRYAPWRMMTAVYRVKWSKYCWAWIIWQHRQQDPRSILRMSSFEGVDRASQPRYVCSRVDHRILGALDGRLDRPNKRSWTQVLTTGRCWPRIG